jgi:hypothetical protein
MNLNDRIHPLEPQPDETHDDPIFDARVISVVKLRVESSDSSTLLDHAAHVLHGEAKALPGFLSGEILVSQDAKTIVILTEWVDSHLWAQARYDLHVGKLLEDCFVNCPTLEFEVYRRHAKFLGPVEPATKVV